MSYLEYGEYKETASEWLGKVPSHWEVVNLRTVVDERTEKNHTPDGSNNYLSLLANVGVTPYEEKGDIGNKKPDDLSGCKLVATGDFVLNSMNFGIGSYGVSPLDGFSALYT